MATGMGTDAMNQVQASNAPRLLTPHGRFFLWYSLALVLFGPFGFAIGPLVAHFLKRRVERKYPQAAYAARQRDTGFNWGQWWVLNSADALGCRWAVGADASHPNVDSYPDGNPQRLELLASSLGSRYRWAKGAQGAHGDHHTPSLEGSGRGGVPHAAGTLGMDQGGLGAPARRVRLAQ